VDSLPAEVIEQFGHEFGKGGKNFVNLEMVLNAGHGACWLNQHDIADLVEEALVHGDGHRYRLVAWCVIPNHVHVLIKMRSNYSGVLIAVVQCTGRKGWPLMACAIACRMLPPCFLVVER